LVGEGLKESWELCLSTFRQYAPRSIFICLTILYPIAAARLSPFNQSLDFEEGRGKQNDLMRHHSSIFLFNSRVLRGPREFANTCDGVLDFVHAKLQSHSSRRFGWMSSDSPTGSPSHFLCASSILESLEFLGFCLWGWMFLHIGNTCWESESGGSSLVSGS